MKNLFSLSSGRIYSCVSGSILHPSLLWQLWIILFFVSPSGNSFAQSLPAANKCTSQELALVQTEWLGKPDNSQLPGNRSVVLTITNKTNSDRKSFVIWATINRYDTDGQLKSSQPSFFCVEGVSKNSTLSLAARDSVYYGQDEQIVLTNVYSAWSSANVNENCDYIYTNAARISPACFWKDSIVVNTGVRSRFTVTPANCGNGKGRLTTRPLGGKGPYRITVSGNQDLLPQIQTVGEADSLDLELVPGSYTITITDSKNISSVFNQHIPLPGEIGKPEFSIIHPDCSNGKGSLNVKGARPEFVYELKQQGLLKASDPYGVFADLEPGDYEIVAVNGVCRSMDTVRIGQKPLVPGKPRVSVTHPDCNREKGVVDLLALEDNVTYRLLQNGVERLSETTDRFTEVEPGVYVIEAAGPACKNSDTLRVHPRPDRPSKPEVVVVHPNCGRALGLIKIANRDSSARYHLKLNGLIARSSAEGEFDEVEPGDYEIEAEKNSCRNADSIRVNRRPDIPGIPAYTVEHPDCSNDKGAVVLSITEKHVTYTLLQNGVEKYTADSGQFIGVEPGTYVLKAATIACRSYDSLMVNQNPYVPSSPSATLIQPDCSNAKGKVMVSLPEAGAMYALSQNGVEIRNQANGIFEAVDPGAYELVAVGKVSGCRSSEGIEINQQPLIPEQPVAAIDQPDCDHDLGTVTIVGAKEGIRYRLEQEGIIKYESTQGRFTQVEPGAYQVIAQADQCAVRNLLTVNEKPFVPAKPSPTIIHPNCVLEKGKVKLAQTDDNAVYYLRQNGVIKGQLLNGAIEAVEPGAYELIAIGRQSSCSITDSLYINVRPALPVKPVLRTSGPLVICSGSTVTLSSSEQAGVLWYKDGEQIPEASGDQFPVKVSGKYSSSSTLNGCVSERSDEVSVIVNTLPETPAVTPAGPTGFCAGGSVTLRSNARAGNQWYKNGDLITGATAINFVAADAGEYSVKATADGCWSATSSATAVIVFDIPAKPSITDNDNLLTSSAAVGNQWYKDGVEIPGATSREYVPVLDGSYTVKVTLNSCESAISEPYTYKIKQNPVDEDEYIKVYPNPSSLAQPAYLRWKLNNAPGGLKVVVMDIYGRILSTRRVTHQVDQLPLPVTSGTYVVMVYWGNGNKKRFELIRVP